MTSSAEPTDPTDRRQELGAFLRAHREALRPADVGQPTAPRPRRRTPGLRREEVAQLCGISTTWYTWLEQGRDISLSPHALARVAEVLRLTAAERAYLFELARKRDPAPPAAETPADAAPSELVAALETAAAPAYLLDPLWCARGWNRSAARLFAGWLSSGEANLLRYVFLDPSARGFISDWENRARRLLAEFRADTADRSDDPAIRSLVAGLMAASPAFARFWNTHAVLAREGGARRFAHPRDGALLYEQVTLAPAAHPGWKLVLLLPQSDAARSRKRRRRRPQ